ncbi:hypothetical protein ABZV34_34125 [Streptomyces sp. NPDC005195]|uniref:hypothetical protein n=1 Tax=Streptomyces sp. NPDC005195 TaxID=3154561 RepID=UPI0033A6B2F3
MSTVVDYTTFAVGCLLALAGLISLLAGWAPTWLRHVERPRLFGAWALCLGTFCVTQLPALRTEVIKLGDPAIDACVVLLLISAAALLLGLRRPRRQ